MLTIVSAFLAAMMMMCATPEPRKPTRIFFDKCPGLKGGTGHTARSFAAMHLALLESDWVIREINRGTWDLVATKCHPRAAAVCAKMNFMVGGSGVAMAVDFEESRVPHNLIDDLAVWRNQINVKYGKLLCASDELLEESAAKYGVEL